MYSMNHYYSARCKVTENRILDEKNRDKVSGNKNEFQLKITNIKY